MTNRLKTRTVTAATSADGKLEHVRHEDLPHLFADVSGITADNSEINILDGATLNVSELNTLNGITAVVGDLNLLAGMAAASDQVVKVAKVALGHADTGAGVLVWANSEAGNVHIEKVLVYVTTVATGTCLIDIGTTAVSATTLSDNLIDGLDVHTATGLFAVADQAGANGKTRQTLATGKWVTGTIENGSSAAAALVGSAYIFYILA